MPDADHLIRLKEWRLQFLTLGERRWCCRQTRRTDRGRWKFVGAHRSGVLPWGAGPMCHRRAGLL